MSISIIIRTVIAAVFIAATAVAVLEQRLNDQLQARIRTLEQQQAALAEQGRQWQRERDDAASRSTGLLAENGRLKSNSDQAELLQLRARVAQLTNNDAQSQNDPIEIAARSVARDINQLKNYLDRHPEEKIPELQYLTDEDWLRDVVNRGRTFKNDDDFKRASSALRELGKNYFAQKAAAALADYIAAHNGQLPENTSALEPYFQSAADSGILQRYELIHTGNLADLSKDEPVLVEKALVDDEFDTRSKIGAFRYCNEGTGKNMSSMYAPFGTNITAKLQLFVRQ